MKKLYILLAVIGIIGLGIGVAQANPQFFPTNTAQTATATTSPVILQAATATTTVVTYDTFASTTGVTTKTTDAALLVQFAATNTAASLNLTRQYSHDGIDWYENNYEVSSTAYPLTVVTGSNIYIWAVPTAATSSKIFSLATPVRYVRIQAKMTTHGGSVWAQVVPNKERAE